MTRSPDHPINYLQPPLGYLVRIPVGDHASDSPLDEPARDRAEQAAAFLRFERIGQIYSVDRPAARDTAEIVWHSCSPDFTDSTCIGVAEIFCEWLLNQDRRLPGVFVADYAELGLVMSRLGISLANQPGDPTGANVCGELVAPGGIISIHRDDEGKIVLRARHMVLDFTFTDLEKAVTWGKADMVIEKTC
ncbi:MAG TPA: hypothetical protein VHW72_01335 [Candidatus Angelobacter sp.]|jgi:hypothetical protein|nr:hypothetical protein [Candidatus Angelobacter sp.]